MEKCVLKSAFSFKGPPSGKRDGVIRHILESENGNWMENVQFGIQSDWVNLA